MRLRLTRLVLALLAVAGATAGCIVVPAGYPARRVYAPPPAVVYAPPAPVVYGPPACRWVWVGRWECR